MLERRGVTNLFCARWPEHTSSCRRGLVVKWLSRLPVTEEIAGSSPVEPAI